ncbi:MAG: O-antigen ligase family protein [Phycisphaerae bacterium]|nr:O-antigen ligase family protein [Phycisphaerae bacterium]
MADSHVHSLLGSPAFAVHHRAAAGAALANQTAEIITQIRKIADRTALILLMLVAGTLLFRPSDLFPSLAALPIYECLVAACLVLSFHRIRDVARLSALRGNAMTALMLLLVPAVMMSHLAHLNTYDARLDGIAMTKASVFFLLIIAWIDTSFRLRAMLWSATCAVLAVAILALLQYHNLINLPALASIVQSAESNGGVKLVRLCGIGVFNDPNDFSLVLVFGAVVCAHGISEARNARVRWLLVAPLLLLAYALFLTHSRGGFLSAFVALLVFWQARFGWRNTIPLALTLLPLLALPMWGPRARVDLDDPLDTFQTRMELWNHSLDAFRSAPLFGVGAGKMTDLLGQVAHNSYVHAFVETGLLGGVAFCGANYLIVRGIWNASPRDAEIATLRPCVLAIVVSYAFGLLALSRCYTVPTQFVFGIGAAYVMMASASGGTLPRLNWRCAARVTGIGVLFLAATHVFVRTMLVAAP